MFIGVDHIWTKDVSFVVGSDHLGSPDVSIASLGDDLVPGGGYLNPGGNRRAGGGEAIGDAPFHV